MSWEIIGRGGVCTLGLVIWIASYMDDWESPHVGRMLAGILGIFVIAWSVAP